MAESKSCARLTSQILFRFGQFLLVVGLVCFILSAITTYWVIRPSVNWNNIASPNETKVTERYGIFMACQQTPPSGNNGRDKCGALWENLNFIDESTVRFIQFIMVLSGILYIISIALEIVQLLPIQKFRNFLAMNRVVEIFAGISAVLILQGMVIFAGEVKNKAERVVGQDEEQTGWSFIVCLMGLGITLTSLVLTVMFRDLPVPEPYAKGGSWVKGS